VPERRYRVELGVAPPHWVSGPAVEGELAIAVVHEAMRSGVARISSNEDVEAAAKELATA